MLYSFATDERSARGVERHCRQDVAYRVICGNRVADHATIARFLVRHETALADLFCSVLRFCDRAGLVASGIVAVDGTKFHANASRDANVDYDQIAREVVADAIAIDEAEDELYGDARGDELPEELQSEAARRAWLARELARDRTATDSEQPESTGLIRRGSLPGCRAGMVGCLRPGASSIRIGGAPRAASRGRGRRGCARPASAWRTNWPPNAAATGLMRSIARTGG